MLKRKDKNNDIAIEVNDVDKSFKVYYDKANTLKERILFWNRNRHEVREVLSDITLTIKRGETVALVGVNGSGKSTLLKLMTQIIYPDKGTIKTYGKLVSLLELGAGFHPDFSGRENIYFNASIFGLSKKEIDERLDDIIAFSELGEYIDNPVRTYYEILAVGDQHFQERCYEKMMELKKEGKTMVFVTHSMSAVKKFCDRAVWLSNGRIRMDGSTEEVVEEYLKVCS